MRGGRAVAALYHGRYRYRAPIVHGYAIWSTGGAGRGKSEHHWSRMPANSGAGKPDGKCHRNYTAYCHWIVFL